ncbi:aromatic ring-hydroxylating dioxygenase subunit alpha [Actinophytocola sp.]|jgi:nitrite reductase/ring-hydroxylating ferredoxin subunit|uniref:aromatic ring-hydroxylating oxygenase subunit alpha n=1 Tax=Actinophytocola sp. TaxID=1872138 RepID=UPI002EDA4BDD
MTATHARYTESALIPKERYISADWLAAEYERLWPKVWQMACRLEQIPRTGDFHEYRIGSQSILVVRESEDSVKAFHNACPHRATRICSGTGNTDDELRCPFHGWAWHLDGSVLEIPDADDFAPEVLSRKDLRLREVHVGHWGGFVFVNLSEDPRPLLDFLAPVVEGLAPFEVDKMRLIRNRTTVMDCNWKVGLAAFNEAYHLEATHIWDLSGYAAGRLNGAARRTRRPAGMRTGESGATKRVDARDPEGRTPGSYQFLYETFQTHNKMRNVPELLTESAPLADMGDPKKAAVEMLRLSQLISLAHQDDIDYVEALDDVPTDVPSVRFFTDVRRKVGAAGGVDYSHIPDEDMLAAIDYCIYPNLVGPISAGNWILFRFRPNGNDPDTCLYDVMFLHRFGDGEQVPEVEHEFYARWEDHDGWGPTIGQDLSNMGHVQAGLHQTSFTALRLNRQEAGVRNFEKFVDSYVLADGDPTA